MKPIRTLMLAWWLAHQVALQNQLGCQNCTRWTFLDPTRFGCQSVLENVHKVQVVLWWLGKLKMWSKKNATCQVWRFFQTFYIKSTTHNKFFFTPLLAYSCLVLQCVCNILCSCPFKLYSYLCRKLQLMSSMEKCVFVIHLLGEVKHLHEAKKSTQGARDAWRKRKENWIKKFIEAR